MTRKDTILEKYGPDYYRNIAKQVKNRHGFQDRPIEEIRAAQKKGAQTKKVQHAKQKAAESAQAAQSENSTETQPEA